MPDLVEAFVGAASLLALYFFFTRCDQFENGNIDRKD